MSVAQVDLTRLEVFRNYLAGAAEEDWQAFRRSAYSLNIKERGDCSAAVFTWDGQMIALPKASVPLHQGSMEGLVEEILRRFPAETIEPGDMFITNDPYAGGSTHSMDYCVAAPFFSAGGELLAFVANVGHHADVGGRVAGSWAVDNQSIFEEGVLIPPVRICRQGAIQQDVLEIIRRNSRMPFDRAGDVRAHVAGNLVGLRRLREVVERLGASDFRAYAAALIDYSERRMRALLRDLPDGEWTAEDSFDGDGVGSEPLRLCLRMKKRGDELVLDWSDVPPQMKSGRNIPYLALTATCFSVLRSLLDPGLHMNAGINRVVKYVAVPGTCLHPLFPAAVSDRATPCQVLADMTADCVGQMMPDRAIAAMGAFQGWGFEGIDPRTGQSYANYETIAGGLGATTFSDGIDAVRGWPAGSMNPPIEAFEQDVPVVVRRYELLQDSGGPGTFRGGLAIRRDLEIRGEETQVTSYAMRQVVPPPGVAGGRPGQLARFVLNPETPEERVLPVAFTRLPLRYGDVISCETPGGGGYGDPRWRDIERVRRDLEEGRISPEQAREAYELDLRCLPRR
jgi:N-methylhydantoinase B